MNLFWGLLMAAVGLSMLVCGTLKSGFIIYRLMVARSRILWSEETVHRMYQVSGSIIMILGLLWALGLIWSN